MAIYIRFWRNKIFLLCAVLFLLTFLIYLFSSRGEGSQWNHFVVLADAFLHGHLYVTNTLTELVNVDNRYYVVYPPMPSFFLIPFVYFFGTDFYQPILSIILGSVNTILAYLLFFRLFRKNNLAIWITILYAFETMQWYHAEVGSSWYVGHIVALFFLWLALLEFFTKKRFFVIGLLIGFAYLSRLPAILACSFILIYSFQDFVDIRVKKVKFKNIALFTSGLLISVLLNFTYNFLRYGTVLDQGYVLLPIFNEPWYQNGLFSIRNIPVHLQEIFTAMPVFSDKFPYLIPSVRVMALWFITPAFILIFFTKFKEKLIYTAAITVLIMCLPSLMHGGNGSTQFGFRYALDYLPFLLILTASGFERLETSNWPRVLVILSIVVNLWGVLMISSFNIWGWN